MAVMSGATAYPFGGCGDTLITSDGGKDAGGNKVLADIGPGFCCQAPSAQRPVPGASAMSQVLS